MMLRFGAVESEFVEVAQFELFRTQTAGAVMESSALTTSVCDFP